MYFIILVLLIVFFATIGFRLVINASIWISGISKDSASISQVDSDRGFLLAPELYDVPDATNSATLAVSGRGTPDTTLTIYLNDEVAEEVELDSDEFNTRIILTAGYNEIYLETYDKKRKKTKDSETYTVSLLTGKPSLSITSPQEGDTRDKPELTVIGETDKDVSIRINNSPVTVGSDGSFQKNIRLKEGDNTVTIRAIDRAKNTTEESINVRYEKDE